MIRPRRVGVPSVGHHRVMVAQSNLLSDSQVHAFCRDGFCIIQPDVAPRLHKLAAAQITALLAAYAHTHTIDTHRLSRVPHCL